MNSKTKYAFLILLISLTTLILNNTLGGCSEPIEINKENAEAPIYALMQSYADAINETNPEKVISHYFKSDDFLIYQDGVPYDYNKTVSQVQTFFPSVKSLNVKWDTVVVRVLNNNTAVAFAPFHESFTDSKDVETKVIGEVTWIANKIGDEWKFVYGHAFHKADIKH
jgi:ketosteroid isomerase-like protein